MKLRYLCLVCACLELPNQYEVIIFALMSTFSDIGTNGEWEVLLFLGFVCLVFAQFLHPAMTSILKVSVCFLQVAQRWILFSYPIHYSVYFEWAIETVNIQSYY